MKLKENNLVLSKKPPLGEVGGAFLCPYESGPAVYNARVLLSTVDNTVYKNDCEDAQPVKNKNVMLVENSTGIAVFPNPANEKLYIAIHLEEGQIATLKVFDLTGKLVLSSNVHSHTDNAEISTITLSEGMYIYKLNVNNTIVNTGKLSIIR